MIGAADCSRGSPPGLLGDARGATLRPMQDVRILYNDACPVCRAEIAHYRARATATGAPLDFEDLNTADLQGWRMTADQAMRRMHARHADGSIVSGVEAFTLIWERLPGYRWLATCIRLPVIRGLAEIAYNKIAAPWLYRRHKRRMALDASGQRP
jgi:predicted DCC family thiol-disulfide oxidoreductase YuxK